MTKKEIIWTVVKTVGLIVLVVAIGCGVGYIIHTTVKSTDSEETQYHTRDAYVHRLESKFDAAREALAIEVDNYIQAVAPNAVVDALNLIDLCSNYGVDIRFVLAQGHVESHFATKGTARRTNSIFNVGAYDGHSANKQIKNGFGYKHPDYSVEPYLMLLTTRYLIDGKTEQDLLDKFVDKDGKRYASSKTYETMLRERIEKMDSIANITGTYEVYCKYKLMLGR